MRRTLGAFVAAGMLAAALAGGAAAKSAPPTKMKFKLDDHHVAEGGSVTGTILVLTGRGKHREPMEGASLSVLVDKVEVATLVTDADGMAEVEYSTTEAGEHVMKVVYAGDDEHKRAKRAQGFEVGGEPELEEEELEEE